MKTITIKKILSWKPCPDYDTEEKLLKITKGKKSLTLKEISNLRIPHKDIVWVLLRPAVLGKRNYKEIGYKIADRAVKKYCLRCGIKEVEEWAKKWLSGEDRTGAAAHTANASANTVYTAANAANVIYASANAAYAAANAAYAAIDAANTAANTAACTFNAAVERKWQLNLIKKYI